MRAALEAAAEAQDAPLARLAAVRVMTVEEQIESAIEYLHDSAPLIAAVARD